MSSKAPAAPTGEAPEGKSKGKSKKMLFIIAGVVFALLAGGAGYYYLNQKKAAQEALDVQGETPAKTTSKVPIFVPLEAFTVNLADTHAEKMAQIAVTLQVNEAKTSDDIKVLMPAIRHHVLKAMASKESRELLTNDGKDKLAEEIALVTAIALGWSPPGEADKEEPVKGKKTKKRAPPPNPIEQVHFSQFIVQ